MIRLPGDLIQDYTSLRGAEVRRGQSPRTERRGNPPHVLQGVLEHRLPELQPRIVIGRPPSAIGHGKHFSDLPLLHMSCPHPAGCPGLWNCSSQVRRAIPRIAGPTTQPRNDLAIQLKGHLRTSFEPSAPQEPRAASLSCSPAVNGCTPAWGQADNCQPLPSTLTAEYFAAPRARRGSSRSTHEATRRGA